MFVLACGVSQELRDPVAGHARSAFLWLSVTVVVAAIVIAAAFAAGLRVAFDTGETTRALLIMSGIGLFAFCCRNVAPRCAVALASFFVLMLAGAAAGTLSMVGQMFGLPLIDRWLAAADEQLGITALDIVRIVVAAPILPKLLAITYVLSPLLILISAFVLSIMGRTQRVWELCAAFSFCLLVATVMSALFPAIGAFAYSGIAAVHGSQLPGGSGVYHLEAFHALRGASEVVINPFKLQGLVTFPSFHTAMALMTTAAWRDTPLIRRPMIAWNALVVVSTIPIGGHYIVDLVGGAATWLAIFRFGPKWIERVALSATPIASSQPA